jgi:hypothetical protein
MQEPDEFLFEQLDREAIRYKVKFFQPAWASGLLLAILWVVLFATGLVFNSYFTNVFKLSLVGFEVMCLSLSASLILVFSRRHKRLFIERRRNANYLQTLLWFKESNLPLLNIEDEIDRNNLKNSSIPILTEILAFEAKLSQTQSDERMFGDTKRKLWIFAEDQIKYYERIKARYIARYIKKKVVLRILSILRWTFLLSISFKYLIQLLYYSHLSTDLLLSYFTFILIIMPSIYIILGFEIERTHKESEFENQESESKIREMLKIQIEVFEAKDFEGLNKTSKKLRIILERGNIEWADLMTSLIP